MAAARIDGQRREIAHQQRLIRQRFQRTNGAVLTGKRQREQPQRIALLGQQQALAMRVPGQAFEALVAGIGETQVMDSQIVQLDAFQLRLWIQHGHQPAALIDNGQTSVIQRLDRLRIGKAGQTYTTQHHTTWREFDQLRVLSRDGPQGAGKRIPGQARSLVLFQSRQSRLQRQFVVGQPDTGSTLHGIDRLFAPVESQLVIPVQQVTGNQNGGQHQQQEGIDDQAPTGCASGNGKHGVSSSERPRITARRPFAGKCESRRVCPAASDHSTRLSNRDSPTSSSTNWSPCSSGPTPAGVPVSTTSPGCRLKCPAMCCSSGRMALSIWLLLPSWRTSPLMLRRMPISPRSSTALAGTKGASTQAPSKLLAISQGWPFSLSFACTSRRVRSSAGAKPETASRISSSLGLRDSGLPIS